MKVRKVFRKTPEDGPVAGAINAVVSANVNEPGTQHTRVSSHQRIVQRNGRTEIFEERHRSNDGPQEQPSKEEPDD